MESRIVEEDTVESDLRVNELHSMSNLATLLLLFLLLLDALASAMRSVRVSIIIIILHVSALKSHTGKVHLSESECR